MSSQIPDQLAVDPDRITFELDRLAVSEPGRVEVLGRWFGIRGRRFMRPTLTLTLTSDGSERRALAELEHKPWAAEDGEPWRAAFVTDVAPDDAAEIELSVAPDINVALTARSSVPTGSPVPTRPPGRASAQEVKRLTAQVVAAEEATQRERARRATAEKAVEDLRAESHRLRAELGRLAAELDLARAAQLETASASSELDAARREIRAARAALAQERTESDRLRARPAPAANPSPGHRTNWLGRAMAVLFMLAVIAAVVLVVHTTISI